jgi:hypothetical protein
MPVAMIETNALVNSVRANGNETPHRPEPHWIAGKCPVCGEVTIKDAFYVGGKGYLLQEVCWSGDCMYRKMV